MTQLHLFPLPHFLALANYTTARIESGKVITSVGTHAYPVDAATAAKQFVDGLPIALVETLEDAEVVRHQAGARYTVALAEHFKRIGARSEVIHERTAV